jgi:porphobilinogen synthase
VQQAVRALKSRFHDDLLVITDVCLCEYTDHGHCGILNGTVDGMRRPQVPDGYLLNDETLELLGRIANSHAESGVDLVAPSGMVDGMVGSIRLALDGAGFESVGIIAYSVKYRSAFYGPFRDAAAGTPSSGDRASHQMDPANAREALREAQLDVSEGADMLMVKPGLAYLDIVRRLRERIPGIPLVAYNVSGEYAMIKAAASAGWLDERPVVLEILTGMRRAGADAIITYHAADVATWLREESR